MMCMILVSAGRPAESISDFTSTWGSAAPEPMKTLSPRLIVAIACSGVLIFVLYRVCQSCSTLGSGGRAFGGLGSFDMRLSFAIK